MNALIGATAARLAAASSEPWMQSLRGRAIDLINPSSQQVDFREIADTLGNITRFGGACEVSVAQHTLICLSAAENVLRLTPTLIAMVLLHDAHEARLGDSITPVEEMRAALAEEMFDADARLHMEQVWREAKLRHDRAIYEAAGLPLPSPEQRTLIRRCDLMALETERRDFMVACKRRWQPTGEKPLASRWKPISRGDASGMLYRAFSTYLPALRGRR